MNRKLQHSIGALTTSAAVFGLLLLAGGPAAPDLAEPTVLMISADVAAEAPDDEAVDAAGAAPATGHVRRSHRTSLAMPYFSFGKAGLRRVTGG